MIEGLLRLLAEDATTFLLGSVLTAAAAGGTPDLAWGTAVALAACYAAVGVIGAAVAFIRRDITA